MGHVPTLRHQQSDLAVFVQIQILALPHKKPTFERIHQAGSPQAEYNEGSKETCVISKAHASCYKTFTLQLQYLIGFQPISMAS